MGGGSLVDSPLCCVHQESAGRMKVSVKGKNRHLPRGVVQSEAPTKTASIFSHLSIHPHRLGVTRSDFSFFSLPGNLERCGTSCSTSLKRLEEHVVFSSHLSLNSANRNVPAILVCRYNTDPPPHTHPPQEENVSCPCYLTCDIVS